MEDKELCIDYMSGKMFYVNISDVKNVLLKANERSMLRIKDYERAFEKSDRLLKKYCKKSKRA